MQEESCVLGASVNVKLAFLHISLLCSMKIKNIWTAPASAATHPTEQHRTALAHSASLCDTNLPAKQGEIKLTCIFMLVENRCERCVE